MRFYPYWCVILCLPIFSLKRPPSQVRKVVIKGMALRGGIIVNDLTWNDKGGHVILTSKIDQVVSLTVKGKEKGKIRLTAGKPIKISI